MPLSLTMSRTAFDSYRAVTDILGRYYSIVLTDSGTGMVHSVMKGTLEKADAVVLVSGGSVDEARLASETLSWLEAHGRQDLVFDPRPGIGLLGRLASDAPLRARERKRRGMRHAEWSL